MTTTLIVTSVVLAIAWLPLAVRFLRGWRNRKNPVSLAICAALCLFAYSNVMTTLVVMDGASMRFLIVATYVFELIVVMNFYVAFKWSERKFPDARDQKPPDYSVPPMNTSNTPRKA